MSPNKQDNTSINSKFSSDTRVGCPWMGDADRKAILHYSTAAAAATTAAVVVVMA